VLGKKYRGDGHAIDYYLLRAQSATRQDRKLSQARAGEYLRRILSGGDALSAGCENQYALGTRNPNVVIGGFAKDDVTHRRFQLTPPFVSVMHSEHGKSSCEQHCVATAKVQIARASDFAFAS
jgi:hypothetical protein